MTTAAILVAAGRGIRAGGDVPKQWQRIAGKTVVEHAIDRFESHDAINEIVLVVAAGDLHWIDDLGLASRVTPAVGGAERSASVMAGLAETSCERVLIHDAARCCVPCQVIDNVLGGLGHSPGSAPAMAVTDALWTGSAGHVTGLQDRDGLFRAQTPQGFSRAEILAAHQSFGSGAVDDVEVARRAGLDVAVVEGDERNLKITTPGDFERAALVLGMTQDQHMDIRTGNGFDVHRFGPGDHVVLCGVEVPHDRSLQGHSDADVGMHTITDAIYGALGKGDIGQHFPPSDPQWKGAASDIFLRHACKLARDMGFDITHIDCTLICELPKIGPVAQSMRETLAEITDISVERISVKATTSERLGFTGRGEGIAAMATATLVKV